MATAGVERVIVDVTQSDGGDPNKLAAMPSLHVALPLALALWAARRGLGAMSLLLAPYAGLIAAEVVYVVDVIGAAALAVVAVFVAEALPRFRLSRVSERSAGPNRAIAPAESGQNLVEFAFMLPVLFLFIGAIVMLAFGMHTRSNLQQAVREGARQAAVGKSLTDVRNLAAGNSGGTLDSTDINWCLPAGSSGSVGDQVRVYVDDGNNGSEGYAFTIIPSTNGIFSAFGVGGMSVNMSPRATARLEKSAPGIPACS
jgi:Flp pilus assembly protein TadG